MSGLHSLSTDEKLVTSASRSSMATQPETKEDHRPNFEQFTFEQFRLETFTLEPFTSIVEPQSHTFEYKLQIVGDLNDMAQRWSEKEYEMKRRIVEFERTQDGSTIFHPVTAEGRPLNSPCISCIWWEEKQKCVVTSVDVIYLLEQLVEARFTVEEKNRIRRNLESFRPLIVSKDEADNAEFFKLIMAFPVPRPRNIEKDCKVFHWADLSSVLKKIVGEYSASPNASLAPFAPFMPFTPSPVGSDRSSITQFSNTTMFSNSDRASTRFSSPEFSLPMPPIGQEPHDRKPFSAPDSDSSYEFDNCSFTTVNDTDSSEDALENSPQSSQAYAFPKFAQLNRVESKGKLVAAVLTSVKQQIIERIMKDFWVIFNRENESTTQAVNTAASRGEKSPDTFRQNSETTTHWSKFIGTSALGKRRRNLQEEQDCDENDDEKAPKRPRPLLAAPQSQDDNVKFACPYRKRDPRKYCLQHWRSCALTPQETVARVKAHLYRYHRIFPCQRCKVLFNDSDAVNMHIKETKGCELNEFEQVDGITPEVHEKMRSKKKTQRDQTEADRWRDIYKLLFPDEIIPSPYFEAVQEDPTLSPDSRELADYEEYCRRELPRDFRAALEEIVHNDIQPIEESIRNQLTTIIRDCQDRVFSRYRNMTENPQDTQSRVPDTFEASIVGLSARASTAPESSFRPTAPLFFHPPPPQSHLQSRLEVPGLNNQMPTIPESNQRSDSGYGSNTPTLHSSSLPIDTTSMECTRASSAQHHDSFETFLDPLQATGSMRNEDSAMTFSTNWADFDPEVFGSIDINEFFTNS